MKADTILGIDPGTRSVGIAVLQSGLLMHYQVRSFHGPWSNKKLKSIVTTLEKIREQYGIVHIAVKIPDTFPTAKGFNQLIGSFNVVWCKRTVSLRYYSFSEIKAVHCTENKKDTAALMQAILQRHPALMTEYLKEQENEEAYYYKVFNAVAVAHMPINCKSKRHDH